MKETAQTIQAAIQNIEKVIVGKTHQIKQILCAWIAGGHVLIEDVPGTGKTILARALAKSVEVDFKRVQFTPDLLPTDIIGTSIYQQNTGQFVHQPGPVFTTILLADEINRASPRTQSALLEAMAESQITSDGKQYELNPLFFVIATQNPVEHQGTFPLPEAQLDRFMLKLSLNYPNRAQELALVQNQKEGVVGLSMLGSVVQADQILRIRKILPQVKISPEVLNYAMDLVAKTRNHPDLKLGASTRAFLALVQAARATALIEGRPFVTPSNIYELAKPILAHRLILHGHSRVSGARAEQVIDKILQGLSVPTGSV